MTPHSSQPDFDVEGMDRVQLKAEIRRIRQVVREHKGEKGHDRCYLDDPRLYREVLPEGGDDADLRLPPEAEHRENCLKYWRDRQPCPVYGEWGLIPPWAPGDFWGFNAESQQSELVSVIKWQDGLAYKWIDPKKGLCCSTTPHRWSHWRMLVPPPPPSPQELDFFSCRKLEEVLLEAQRIVEQVRCPDSL